MLFRFPRLTTSYLPRKLALRFASTMAAKVTLEKNHHHLKVDQKEENPIDWKAVKAHISFVASKYKDNDDSNIHSESKLAYHPHPDKDHDVTLKPQGGGVLWTGPLLFGGQKIYVDFDTGSTSVILNKDAYHPSKSKTSLKTNATFKTSYGDGTTATGSVYKDEVVIAGLPAIPGVGIGVASTNYLNKTVDHGNAVGLVGLAFPVFDELKEGLPVFDAIMKAKVLEKNVFSFAINKSKKERSELTFGATSDLAVKGEPAWVSVDPKKGFWLAPATVNGHTKINAIVDSGTTLIIMPYAEAKKFLGGIKGLTLQYDEKDLIYATYEGDVPPKTEIKFGDKTICLTNEAAFFDKDDKGRNVYSIIGQDMGITEGWVMGDPLFESAVTTFDRDHNRVGFSDYSDK